MADLLPAVLTPMTHWLALDWVLLVIAAWLLIAMVGVVALRR
ncbi:MAG: hypothetical protein RL375_4666, partial [Pseudomonadota bacterium]